MRRVTTVTDLRATVGRARADGATVALVPTMGALHEGHLSLVRHAADHAELVVVSIFVNPTQFDRDDDLAAYPRDLAGDEAALAALGDQAPQVVFAPPVDEVYPRPPLTTVSVAGLTDHLCGASRPGHFDGVATVVTKLLNLVTPDVAVFGRKDRQQLEVIRRLVADLDLPVTILAAPTAREDDGLARSSRNRRLDATERVRARALPGALGAAVAAARRARRDHGPVTADVLRAAALGVVQGAPGVALDYLEVVDPSTLAPLAPGDAEVATTTGTVLVAVAANVGPVRLIDNVEVGDSDDEGRLLDALGVGSAGGEGDTDVRTDDDAPGGPPPARSLGADAVTPRRRTPPTRWDEPTRDHGDEGS